MESPQTTPELEIDLVSEPIEPEEGQLKGRSKTGLPVPPAATVKPEVLFEYLKRLNENDWAHCDVYVNDKWPVCTRKPAYIAKLQRPIDMAYFERVLGSGDYIIRVNDSLIPGDRRTVCLAKLSFRDPAYPPQRFLEEVNINDPANREYVDQLRRDGKLNSKGEIMQQGQSSDGPAVATLASALVDATKQKAAAVGPDPVVALIQKQMEQQHAELVESRRQNHELMVKLSAPPPPAANPLEPFLALLTSQLKSSQDQLAVLQKQQHELTLKQLEKRDSGGFDIDRYLELDDKLAERRAKLNPAPPEDERAGWMKLAEQALPFVGQISTALAARAAGPASAAPPAARPVFPSTMMPTNNPTLPDNPETRKQFEECRTTVNSYGNYLLASLDAGEEGAVFAERVEATIGWAGYEKLAQYGQEMLCRAILSVPDLAQKIAGREALLVAFIDGFCTWGEETEENEPGDAGQAAAAVDGETQP